MKDRKGHEPVRERPSTDPKKHRERPAPQPPPIEVEAAVQLRQVLTDPQRDEVIARLQDMLPGTPAVRSRHHGGVETFGIWRQSSTDADVNRRRDNVLEKLDILATGEDISIFVNKQAIVGEADRQFAQVPKHLNAGGHPVKDPEDATIILERLDVSLSNGMVPGLMAIVTLQVEGRISQVVEADFTIRSSTTLMVSGGDIHVATKNKLDVEESLFAIIAGALMALPPLGVDLWRKLSDAPGKVDARTPPLADLVRGFFPEEVLLPLGLKLDVAYRRLSLEGGIVAAGVGEVVRRIPELHIEGPTQLSFVDSDLAHPSRQYSLRTNDLRSPVRILWGDGAEDPNAYTTQWRFSLPTENAQGHKLERSVIHRTVSARVIDADDLEARASIDVTIHRVPNGEPAFCSKKPWLCGPGRP